MKEMVLLFIMNFLAASVFFGCSVKEQPKIEHEHESKERALELRVDKQEDKKNLEDGLSDEEAFSQIYPNSWEKYKKLMVNSARLSTDQLNELYEINMLLTRLIVSNDQAMSVKVRDGLQALFSEQNCEEGSCRLMRVLNHVENSAELFFSLAKYEENIERKYRLLTFAIDLQSRIVNKSILTYYTKNFSYLEEDLIKKNKHKELKKYRDVLLYIQKQINFNGKDQVLELIDQLDLWSFSRNVSDYERVKSQEEFFHKAMEYSLLDCDKGKCRVNDSLVKSVKQLLPKENTLFLINKYKGTKVSHKTLKEVNALEMSLQDVNFFFLESVFYGIYSFKEARAFWRGSGQTFVQFWSDVERYLKIKLFLETLESNEFFQNNFYAKENFTSSDLFQKAISDSYVLTTRWDKFWSRVDRLHSVVINVMGEVSTTQKRRRQIGNVFTSMRENVKYMAVYPNMMALIYKLSEANFEFTLRTIFGTFKIDTKMIAKIFFQGKIEPWFNFGNDKKALSRYGIINSFHYALKTGIFESYGIDPEDFLMRLVGELMRERLDSLEVAKEDFKIRVENNIQTSHLFDLCSKIKEKRPYKYEISVFDTERSAFLRRSSRAFLGHGDMDFFSNTDTTIYSDGTTTVTYGLMPIGAKYDIYMEDLRTVYTQDVRLLKQLLKTYQLFLQWQGMSQEGSLEKTKKIKGKLDWYEQGRRKFVNKYKQSFEKYTECLEVYKELVFDNQVIFFKQEEQHLRDIHAQLKNRLQNGDMSYKKTSHLPAVEEWTGFDFIKGSDYHYYKLDVLYRMANRIANHYPGVKVKYPTSVETDDDFRRALKKEKKVVLTYDEDVEAFVRRGLHALDSKKSFSSSFVNWIGSADTYAYWTYHVKILAMFLRTSESAEEEGKWREQIIQSIRKKLKNMWLTPEEIGLLEKHGVNARYRTEKNDMIGELFTDFYNGSAKGFFDKVFDYTISPQLGAYYKEEASKGMISGDHDRVELEPRFHNWDEMLMIAQEAKNQDYFLWDLPKEIKKERRKVGDKLFKIEVEKPLALYKRISEEQKKSEEGVDTDWKLMLDPERVSEGPFLSPSMYLKFRNQVKEIHQKTDGFYKK